MFVILLITVALVGWALHLMEAAVERKEFSLMLAGFLVASAAAALVAVYFLMGSYMGYMTHHSDLSLMSSESIQPPLSSWTMVGLESGDSQL